eukprot:scaffold2236_cov136-Isochrysis_galbana.AAC.12
MSVTVALYQRRGPCGLQGSLWLHSLWAVGSLSLRVQAMRAAVVPVPGRGGSLLSILYTYTYRQTKRTLADPQIGPPSKW